MLTIPPVPYDYCIWDPISRLHIVGCLNSVLNVKAVVAFNKEKALVGTFVSSSNNVEYKYPRKVPRCKVTTSLERGRAGARGHAVLCNAEKEAHN